MLLRFFIYQACTIFLLQSSLYSQTVYPQNDFRSPLDIPLSVAGNFGELRPNHFHGGIDMQQLLPNGTPEQVRREVRRYCDILGRGGGYILAPAHLFQPDVPPENILACYET